MSITKPHPFIGVAGLGSREQHHTLLRHAESILTGTGRFIMTSVLACEQTQLHDEPNEFGEAWYPVGDAISRVADGRSEQVRVFVHMDRALLEAPEKLLRRTAHYIAGVQINLLPWDDTATLTALRRFRKMHPELLIILQAHREVLASFTPEQVADKLRHMPADYLLLDASQGNGTALNTEQLRSYITAIYHKQLPVRVVVAGGLEAATIPELLLPLLRDYPDLSCDAEGRLRQGHPGQTTLNMQAVIAYLEAWRAALHRSTPIYAGERKIGQEHQE